MRKTLEALTSIPRPAGKVGVYEAILDRIEGEAKEALAHEPQPTAGDKRDAILKAISETELKLELTKQRERRAADAPANYGVEEYDPNCLMCRRFAGKADAGLDEDDICEDHARAEVKRLRVADVRRKLKGP